MGAALRLYAIQSLCIAVALPLLQSFLPARGHRALSQTLGRGFQATWFSSRDGLEIYGAVADPEPEQPGVVLLHGVGSNFDDWMLLARSLKTSGIGVAAFDWRAQGKSQGMRIRYGADEPKDLLGVLDALAARPAWKGRPLAILAVSLGSGCAAMAGEDLPPEVKALVLHSPYGSMARMLDSRLSILGPLAILPRFLLNFTVPLFTGLKISSIQPEVPLQGFAPRPVLVLADREDPMIPAGESFRVYQSYPGPKQWRLFPWQGHAISLFARPRDWLLEVGPFLEEALLGMPPTQELLRWTPKGWRPELASPRGPPFPERARSLGKEETPGALQG